MTEHGDAIVARREAIAAEPRPRPATERATEVRETDDLWRVYRPEWVTVFTATSSGTDPEVGLAVSCAAHFRATYAGRVRTDDWAIEVTGDGPTAVARLRLRLPTMKAEWKTQTRAENYVRDRGWTITFVPPVAWGHGSDTPPIGSCWVVARNSARDHQLRAYGVKRLGHAGTSS